VAVLGYSRYYAELDAETARLADVVRTTDQALAVPTCPEWSLADLAVHVGQGNRWAASMVERRVSRWLPRQETDDPEPPRGGDRLADWLLASARRVGTAVREAGPDAAVWTWAEEQTAGFWLRRLTHEAVIHRLDADLAVGRPAALSTEVAADGVSDLLACIATLSSEDAADPVFAGLRGDGQTLHFHATDDGLGSAGEWFVRRNPSGVRWEHGHRKGDVAVRGPALDLLLVLNRRATAGVSVLGDGQLFAHWLANSAW
jgi:uncharacterized protein (TIGR03083 family)